MTSCLACHVIVGLVSQISMQTGQPIITSINNLCSNIGAGFTVPVIGPLLGDVCAGFLDTVASQIEQDFEQRLPPEVTCLNLGVCSEYGQCKLFKSWPVPPEVASARLGMASTVKKPAVSTNVSDLFSPPSSFEAPSGDFFGKFS